MTKISQVHVLVDPFVACTCNSIVLEGFIRKRIKTLVWTRIECYVFDAYSTVSTGPETDKERTKEKKMIYFPSVRTFIK